MCVARLLLLCLTPLLPFRSPRHTTRLTPIMEGHNVTTIADTIWAEVIPSSRVFLTSAVLLLFLAILVMVVVLLFLRVVRALRPRPLSAPRTEMEMTAITGEPRTEETSNTQLDHVRFDGSNEQTARKRTSGTQSPVTIFF